MIKCEWIEGECNVYSVHVRWSLIRAKLKREKIVLLFSASSPNNTERPKNWRASFSFSFSYNSSHGNENETKERRRHIEFQSQKKYPRTKILSHTIIYWHYRITRSRRGKWGKVEEMKEWKRNEMRQEEWIRAKRTRRKLENKTKSEEDGKLNGIFLRFTVSAFGQSCLHFSQ